MVAENFSKRYGPWALVTGAASGLGKELTRQLAALGLHIVAVDIQKEQLEAQVATLRQEYNIQAKAITLDLAEPDLLDKIIPETTGLEIGLLANVAALSYVGQLLNNSLEFSQRQIAVNCHAPLTLAYYFGKQMRARQRGGIIFFSSSSAYQGTALVSNYAATKAYNLILAEGLGEELRDSGVDVLSFAPGATNTPGFHYANPQYKTVTMPYMEPEPTIAEALDALGKTPSTIAGLPNRLASILTSRLMPRKQAIKLFGDNMRKLYPTVAK